MGSLKLLGLLGFLNIIVLCSGGLIEGYYWREFGGEIPPDALPGGKDYSGNPIYIGKVLHGDKLLVAKIYANDPKGYYGIGAKEYTGTNNIKILCVTNPAKFEWIKTNKDELNLLTNKHVIVGGAEPNGVILYIGRSFNQLETSIGKVVSTKAKTQDGLYLTKDGTSKLFTAYEVLVYDPLRTQTAVIANTL